ncbi:serine/threonine protein kinase [Paenibacillus sp. CGMCC 1.16610]|uniref:Serine/threonine protein kinase n=1 Tax=Paenibacillus anseongense TaxID=2682845 RepID=A0ABW9UF53_9BACL|nr:MULTISPECIES: serine/threonine protein kinase [Paenibacillus]MBA2938603.1 serine/threonine protein kinase [Paenibacillus sp. CGMCC 1.16610]MVQ38794.1 serine/threonine protein kinase [Paenibacillus anseongense]
MIETKIDDVIFKLQEEHDFGWLASLGRVFQVFDQQDSGNISFGVEKNGERLFVKYAGAKAITFSGDPQDAIHQLKSAIPLYLELSHPSLIKLVDHFEVGSGYAAVFEWFEGETLHPHWSFPPPAKYNDPRSPFYRFKNLSVAQRLDAMERIFSFHAYIEKNNFVAIDFYDGSLLYNFSKNETKICDIDLYQRRPYFNTMGRLWGSSRFMSPEEFTLGAEIDGCTNVFNMGATAFALLGGERDRSFELWEAGEELYQIALKAVEPSRENRYESVSAFKMAWDSAVK